MKAGNEVTGYLAGTPLQFGRFTLLYVERRRQRLYFSQKNVQSVQRFRRFDAEGKKKWQLT